MGYASVQTAQTDSTTVNRVLLALQRRAAIRIAALTSTEDQRERQVCVQLFNTPTTAWVTLVLLQLDSAGSNLTTVTDTEIDAAVNTIWGRLVRLVG